MRQIDADELKQMIAYITYQKFKAMACPGDEWTMFTEKEIEDIIDKIPTADTVSDEHIKDAFETGYKMAKIEFGRRPQGEWIFNGVRQGLGRCNKCGEIRKADNFCSNCGVQMAKAGDTERPNDSWETEEETTPEKDNDTVFDSTTFQDLNGGVFDPTYIDDCPVDSSDMGIFPWGGDV